MRVTIKPSKLCGKFIAPPSKSFAHRILISSALSGGKSKIKNISESQDMLATIDCISALGASFEKSGNEVEILGTSLSEKDFALFPCRESGSTLRFFFPIALAVCKKSVFTGSKRLLERGIGIYENIFENKGIEIFKTDTEITVTGTLPSGDYTLRGDISSQYISGLLFALPLLSGNSSITVIPPFESKPYINITLEVLEKFGIKIARESENRFLINGNQRYSPCNMAVEGDWSNSAVFFALNALGSDIEITGLNDDSLQGDSIIKKYIKLLEFENPTPDISDCPDLAPVLFALAAAKNGAEFTGTKRLKIKESDRASAMRDELLKFGIKAKIFDNSVKIYKGRLTPPKNPINSHNDHRIVMATSILLTLTGGIIEGGEAVFKSFPDFFEVLKSLGAEVLYET